MGVVTGRGPGPLGGGQGRGDRQGPSGCALAMLFLDPDEIPDHHCIIILSV